MNDKTLVSNPDYMAEHSEEINRINSDKELVAELECAIKDLESFNYSVSHDLRAPLRSINGFAQVLLKDKSDNLDDEGKKYLGIIIGNALRMDRLIDDLLNLSRYNTKPLVKQEVDINELIEHVIGGMTYTTEIRLNKMKPVLADPDLLKQVWTNLISNAIKYSSKKPNPVIEIGAQEMGAETIYYIKDNGVGFDKKYSGKLFTVFQRMHTEREFPGEGVGLAIVHRIITRHGGKIWADSEIDEGSTFYFTLSTT